MAEAQLQPFGTVPAQDFARSFFRSPPTDARYIQCTYQKYTPSSSIDSDTIVFQLDKFESASIYEIQNACIKVRCKITKANGELPSVGAKVWPVNNILHSLFSIVRVKVNEQVVVKQPDHYPYKAILAQIFSYQDEVKNCLSTCHGYYKDLSGHMQNTDYTVNSGFQSRNNLFRKNYDPSKDYRKDGAEFFGRLQLDLVTLDTGLPPRSKVLIELVKSASEFVLMRDSSETENYQIKITSCNLFVPVAQVSAPVYAELGSIISSKDVSLHYRKIEIRPLTIPRYYKLSLKSYSSKLYMSLLLVALTDC